MLKVVLGLVLIAQAFAQCSKGCVRPKNYYNFTRFPLQDVINDIVFYFPSEKHPPSEFTSDSRSLPVIKFMKPAKLKVTFVFEGAGYRNQLGFFTFHYERNPVTGILDVPVKDYEELLIPDASYENNCLWGGLTVDSNKTMQAGEYLGFFLRSNGLCETNPATFYSLPQFNTRDVGIRHIGTYLDRFRELLIFGFEDLVGLGDADFEDTMFFFDAEGLSIDFGSISRGCTNPPCRNGGSCDYNLGVCNCINPAVYGSFSCQMCNCVSGDPCVNTTCSSKQCIPTVWTDNTSDCLRKLSQQCISEPITPCTTNITEDTTPTDDTSIPTDPTDDGPITESSETTETTQSSLNPSRSGSSGSGGLRTSSRSSASVSSTMGTSALSSATRSVGTIASKTSNSQQMTDDQPSSTKEDRTHPTANDETLDINQIEESAASLLSVGTLAVLLLIWVSTSYVAF